MIFEKQIVAIYKNTIAVRCDDNGTAYYFSAADFDGLLCTPYTFKSKKDITLQGYIYSYEDPDKDSLVVFDHGFGGGHRSYMKEIERLCRAGFTVFAYDHTGCMESGGENTGGLSQSLSDLDDCITVLEQDERFKGRAIYVVGHSWGGYSTMNIAALHKSVKKIVGISGFVSVPLMTESVFGGIMKYYRPAILAAEREVNSAYVDMNAVDSIKNSGVKALLIYSDDDKMCRKNPHFDTLKKNLEGLEGVTLVLEQGKGHNPNYTKDAVQYLGEYLLKKSKTKLKTEKQKQAFVASFDWNRMTSQDSTVWDKIIEHLK